MWSSTAVGFPGKRCKPLCGLHRVGRSYVEFGCWVTTTRGFLANGAGLHDASAVLGSYTRSSSCRKDDDDDGASPVATTTPPAIDDDAQSNDSSSDALAGSSSIGGASARGAPTTHRHSDAAFGCWATTTSLDDDAQWTPTPCESMDGASPAATTIPPAVDDDAQSMAMPCESPFATTTSNGGLAIDDDAESTAAPCESPCMTRTSPSGFAHGGDHPTTHRRRRPIDATPYESPCVTRTSPSEPVFGAAGGVHHHPTATAFATSAASTIQPPTAIGARQRIHKSRRLMQTTRRTKHRRRRAERRFGRGRQGQEAQCSMPRERHWGIASRHDQCERPFVVLKFTLTAAVPVPQQLAATYRL
jgi:hypothetical protein